MSAKKTAFLLFLALLFAAAAAYGVGVLLGHGDRTTGAADATDAELVALGERVYGRRCAECHGADLRGQPDWRRRLADGTLPAPPHDATGHTWHHADALLFDYTKLGGQSLMPQGVVSGMPGFGETLTDRQIWAALAYIKSRWPVEVRVRQARLNEDAE